MKPEHESGSSGALLPSAFVGLRDELTAAAARRLRRRRSRRAAVLAVTCAVALGASAAATDGYHFLYGPSSSGELTPLDDCIGQGPDVLVCTSPVGTQIQLKDSSGMWVSPGDCTPPSLAIERCKQPFPVTIDLSDPQHPKIVRGGT